MKPEPQRINRVRSISQQSPSSMGVVDWSYRQLKTLDGLQCMSNTEHLILDGNQLDDRIQFPFMPCLKTLSINNNKQTQLEMLCEKIRSSCPAVTHLSLIGNPACPYSLTGFDGQEYLLYRHIVISRLPQLKFLDSTGVKNVKRNRFHTEPSKTSDGRGRSEYVNKGVWRMLYGIGFLEEGRDKVEEAYEHASVDKNNLKDKEEKDKSILVKKIERRYTGKNSEGNRFIRDDEL